MQREIVEEAIFLFVGWDQYNHSRSLPERVLEKFGDELGAELLELVRSLLDEYWEAGFPDGATVKEATDHASKRFAASHPEISSEGVRALAWDYSFNNR